MSVVIVVCVESVVSVVCQMEISEISRILVERSPTESGGSI